MAFEFALLFHYTFLTELRLSRCALRIFFLIYPRIEITSFLIYFPSQSFLYLCNNIFILLYVIDLQIYSILL